MAEKVAKQVLCLPIFPDLELSTIEKIAGLILSK
jgi:dTDP-4-amino-4,6-dideoxygalactose transaminase